MSSMVSIWIDGVPHRVVAGQSVAAVLLDASPVVRVTSKGTRGLFCGMGSCLECRVDIDGQSRLACLTEAIDGMRISTRQTEGSR